MTKADLIEEVSRVTELNRKEAEAIVEEIFGSVVNALRGGDKVEIRGFGSFRTRERQARIGRNPKTGAPVEVPSRRIPHFKPSKELKDLVNTVAPANALWGQTKAKDFLCNAAARKMTKAMLDLRDPTGEVRGWLKDIKEMHRIAE